MRGDPIKHDVKRLRAEPQIKNQHVTATLANDIIRLFRLEGRTLWNCIRGKPIWKRKATILLSGKPGTGKSLLSKIMTMGMTIGYIDSFNDAFPITELEDVEVGVWEEGHLMFQHVPLFKKVLEGRDYVINKKHN